jgi:hypothetical protein
MTDFLQREPRGFNWALLTTLLMCIAFWFCVCLLGAHVWKAVEVFLQKVGLGG